MNGPKTRYEEDLAEPPLSYEYEFDLEGFIDFLKEKRGPVLRKEKRGLLRAPAERDEDWDAAADWGAGDDWE